VRAVRRAVLASLEHRTGALLVKLPVSRVAEVIAEGSGEPFAPAGRTFREWVAVCRGPTGTSGGACRAKRWRTPAMAPLRTSPGRRSPGLTRSTATTVILGGLTYTALHVWTHGPCSPHQASPLAITSSSTVLAGRCSRSRRVISAGN
jgi:hypothetical protein